MYFRTRISLPPVALGACLLSCGASASDDPSSTSEPPVSEATPEIAPEVAPATAGGCPLAIADLSAPAWLSPDDPRLSGGSVIVVLKEARRIGLYSEGALAEVGGAPACWSVGLAMGYPSGPKRQEGDMKTPEGWYATSDKPWSSFYNAVAVHYPNEADADAGVEAGLISEPEAQAIRRATQRREKPAQTTAMGGEILIHGGGGRSDWTLGCVAMDDDDIDALRALLPASMRTDALLLP